MVLPTECGRGTAAVGAPDPEIEITPAMVDAGLEAYWAHDPEHDLSTDIVRDVFTAMAAAQARSLAAS